jgi:hypothetical protein
MANHVLCVQQFLAAHTSAPMDLVCSATRLHQQTE